MTACVEDLITSAAGMETNSCGRITSDSKRATRPPVGVVLCLHCANGWTSYLDITDVVSYPANIEIKLLHSFLESKQILNV